MDRVVQQDNVVRLNRVEFKESGGGFGFPCFILKVGYSSGFVVRKFKSLAFVSALFSSSRALKGTADIGDIILVRVRRDQGVVCLMK